MHIDFDIGHFRNFWTSTTLTLDQAIWHTVVYHSLTSTYIPNVVQIEFFVDGRMGERTLLRV